MSFLGVFAGMTIGEFPYVAPGVLGCPGCAGEHLEACNKVLFQVLAWRAVTCEVPEQSTPEPNQTPQLMGMPPQHAASAQNCGTKATNE